MRFRLLLAIALLWCLPAWVGGTPVVANVRGSQRNDGTGRVDIYYDVAGASGRMIVSVVLSNNDGATWSVLPTTSTLSGDVGVGITNGAGKHILWEAGLDRPNVYWPKTRVKISAAEVGITGVIMLPGNVPLEMVRIPAGTFMMGSDTDPGYSDPNQMPRHEVTINYDFFLGKYEVTQRQWVAVMGSNPSHFTGNLELPVDSVSWNDCQTFITALNKLGVGTYRLPSESEWEYASRAGTTTRWSFGNDPSLLGNYAWYTDNANNQSHPVGGKLPNPFGLYDMHGNVWEWIQDWYRNDYNGAPVDGSALAYPWINQVRCLRGGCWGDVPFRTTSICRASGALTRSDNYLGLRLARTQ